MWFKLFSPCHACKKRRVYTAKRSVRVNPLGRLATSKDFFGNCCFTRSIRKKLEHGD